MKTKASGLAILWFILGVGSCSDFSDFALPESATVKGEPGFHVPIGYISKVAGEENSVAYYIGEDKIQDLAGGGNIRIYSYNKPFSSVRTYLIHYQIASLNLDLSKYVQALNVTEAFVNDAGTIPGTGDYIPIPIPLDTMGKWIPEVNNAKFAVRLTMSGPSGFHEVSVKMSKGNTAEQTKLFTSTPQILDFDSGIISSFVPSQGITVSIKAPIGTFFKLEVDFDWEEARVFPGDEGVFKDAYTGLDKLGELTDFLGGSAFKEVSGFMYVNGLPGEEAAMSLEAKTKSNAKYHLVTNKTITPGALPDLSNNLNSLPPDSLGRIRLEKAFNEGVLSLDYKITMGAAIIRKSDSNLSTITADMLIELPLEFIVSNKSDNPFYWHTHVKLDLGGVMPSMNEEDLFGRTGEKEDILNSVGDVTIRLSNYTNNIITSLGRSIAIGVYIPATRYGGGITLAEGKPSEITINGKYPFSPKFEILIPIDNKESQTGTLQILRPQPGDTEQFDFFLEVDAQVSIDQSITF
ncbi:MAG: hypothetical protein LBD29_07765 [Treponema sp.]|nr:hypothetical protein [Treponema sp.]